MITTQLIAARARDQATALYAKAYKNQHSKTWFFQSRADHLFKTAQLFVQAAQLFKCAHVVDDAAKAYFHAGETYSLVDNGAHAYEAAEAYVNAANLSKQVDGSRVLTLQAYRAAFDCCLKAGKFVRAARIQADLAGVLEKEKTDWPAAAIAYAHAGKLYQVEQQPYTARTCLSKQAELYTRLERYQAAATVYEELSQLHEHDTTTTTTTLHTRAHLDHTQETYLLKAFLCHVLHGGEALDVMVVSKRLDAYVKQTRSAFLQTSKGKLCEHVANALEMQSYDALQFQRHIDGVGFVDDEDVRMLLTLRRLMKQVAYKKDQEDDRESIL